MKKEKNPRCRSIEDGHRGESQDFRPYRLLYSQSTTSNSTQPLYCLISMGGLPEHYVIYLLFLFKRDTPTVLPLYVFGFIPER